MELKALGQHLLVDLYGCDSRVLDELEQVRGAVLEAASLVDATVLGVVEHQFEPQGVTVVVVIAESHVSVHTWPEHGYAAVDVFTCGGDLAAGPVVDLLTERFRAREATAMEVKRGIRSAASPLRTAGDRLIAPA